MSTLPYQSARTQTHKIDLKSREHGEKLKCVLLTPDQRPLPIKKLYIIIISLEMETEKLRSCAVILLCDTALSCRRPL